MTTATRTSTRPDRRWAVSASRGWSGTTLLGLLLLVGAAAVYGGIGLMASGLGMPVEWLDRLPVDTWTWPGAALLLTVAAPQLAAAVVVWRRDARAGIVGLVVGAALVLWIVVQLALLQRYFFLQPVIAGVGVIEMLLAGWWIHRSAGRRVET